MGRSFDANGRKRGDFEEAFFRQQQSQGRVVKTLDPTSTKLAGCVFVTNEVELMIPVQPLAICYFVKCPTKYVSEIENALVKQMKTAVKAHIASRSLGPGRRVSPHLPLQGARFELLGLRAEAADSIENPTELEKMRAYDAGFNPIIRVKNRMPGTIGCRIWLEGKSEAPPSLEPEAANLFACVSLLLSMKIEL